MAGGGRYAVTAASRSFQIAPMIDVLLVLIDFFHEHHFGSVLKIDKSVPVTDSLPNAIKKDKHAGRKRLL
jgi:biopolymer transport protein ExbD